ncbi:ATP-dependent DNA helicase [Trichonephila clavipes]|nr:ATP-dependent DNA helicase [Trichonephila clavipes]
MRNTYRLSDVLVSRRYLHKTVTASGQSVRTVNKSDHLCLEVLTGLYEDTTTPRSERKSGKTEEMPEDISFGREMVCISRRYATVSLNRNRPICAKRNHFQLKPACSFTIHKSQGGKFDEIVNQYNNSHSHPLVHLALSRFMAQGLHIVPTDGCQRFYYGR